jgi:hypothetical protein
MQWQHPLQRQRKNNISLAQSKKAPIMGLFSLGFFKNAMPL